MSFLAEFFGLNQVGWCPGEAVQLQVAQKGIAGVSTAANDKQRLMKGPLLIEKERWEAQ
jgi:hypothetical protein